MAIDKAIDSTAFDSKLTTVADAIRTAGGTTEPMSFPSGMVEAISVLKSGSEAGGVQSDWNQNDNTASDYVKNRPFYTGVPVETVFVEERTVSFAEINGMYMGQLESTFSATVGETYKVYWDGVAYECAGVKFNNVTVIGNLYIIGGVSNTGEPFVIDPGNSGITIMTVDAAASHTFSISGIAAPIVKIPAKYIDKNSSGYVVIHSKDTMTQQEAQNYRGEISRNEVVFIIWDGMCISEINFGGTTVSDLILTTQNGEDYRIQKNSDGLFVLSNRKFETAHFPTGAVTGDGSPSIHFNEKKIQIIPGLTSVSVGSTDVLFKVEPDGTKSKAFEVLGNGEAIAPALILYSSTANSTKKFRITVDDSGTISATEVT